MATKVKQSDKYRRKPKKLSIKEQSLRAKQQSLINKDKYKGMVLVYHPQCSYYGANSVRSYHNCKIYIQENEFAHYKTLETKEEKRDYLLELIKPEE